MSSTVFELADQFVQSCRARLPGAADLGQQLWHQAQVGQVASGASQWSGPQGSIQLLQGPPAQLRLWRQSGSWHCLSLCFRADGGSVLDVDGEGYYCNARGQVEDDAEQDERLDQLMQKVAAAAPSSLAPATGAVAPELDELSKLLLGVGANWLSVPTVARKRPLPPEVRIQVHPDPLLLVKGGSGEVLVQVRGPGGPWILECGDLPLRSRADGEFEMSIPAQTQVGDSGCAEQTLSLGLRCRGEAAQFDYPVRILTFEPGLVLFSPLPLVIPGDAEAEAELRVSLLQCDESGKRLQASAEALAQLQFDGLRTATKALEAAELQFRLAEVRGEGVQRHAVFRVRCGVPVPGVGYALGSMTLSLPGVPSRILPLALQLDSVVSSAESGKEEEKRLLLDVLERYFVRPGGELTVFAELLRSALEQHEPELEAGQIRRTRQWILKEAVRSWKAIGRGYMHDPEYSHRLLNVARVMGWQP